MDYLLLAVSIIITLTYTLIRNSFSKKYVGAKVDYHVFNALCSVVSAVVLIIIAVITNSLKFSVYTLVLGVIFGGFTAFSALFNMQALECGPMSYTTLLCTSSMIIPALSGLAFFGEPVAIWQYAGIALMIVSIFLSVWKTDSGSKKSSVKWLLLCLAAMLFTGLIGVMQKIHQSDATHKDELLMFLVVAFAVSAVYSGIACIYRKKIKCEKITLALSFKSPVIWFVLVSGTCIAFANQINLYLSGVVESIIFFPVVNGGSLLLSILASVVFLKEKLTKYRWAGIIIGCAAIALLCINP